MATAFTISEISFIQKGKGQDLLFLHGYLSSKEAFLSQISYFSKFYRVTALDFVGFGQSAPLKEAYSVSDYAAWTKQAMLVLNVRKPHVVAHSFGCRVAVKMAGEDADIFDKILLTGPAGVILKRGIGYHCKVKAYRLVKKIAPRFAKAHFGSKEYRSLSPIMQESYKKIVNEDLRVCAKNITNEVLIVEGARDTTTPKKEALAYLSCLKNGRLKMLDGGHFAFVDNPILFNLITEEFFYE